MKKKIAMLTAIFVVLGAAISVSAASTNPAPANSANVIDYSRWETTSLGANW